MSRDMRSVPDPKTSMSCEIILKGDRPVVKGGLRAAVPQICAFRPLKIKQTPFSSY